MSGIKSQGFYSLGSNFPWLFSVLFPSSPWWDPALTSPVCTRACPESERHLRANERLVFQPTPVGSVHVDSGTSAITRDSHLHRDRPSQQALRNQVRCSRLLRQRRVGHLSECLSGWRSSKPLEVAGADSRLSHGERASCLI